MISGLSSFLKRTKAAKKLNIDYTDQSPDNLHISNFMDILNDNE